MEEQYYAEFTCFSWLLAQENGDELYVGILSTLLEDASGLALHMIHDGDVGGTATLDLTRDMISKPYTEDVLLVHGYCADVRHNNAFMRAFVRGAQSGSRTASSTGSFMLDASAKSPFAENKTFDTESHKKLEISAIAADRGAKSYHELLGFRLASTMDGTGMLPFHPVLVGNRTLPSVHGGSVAGFMHACLQNRMRFAAPGAAVETVPTHPLKVGSRRPRKAVPCNVIPCPRIWSRMRCWI